MKTILNPLKLITLLILFCPCLHAQVTVKKSDTQESKNTGKEYTTTPASASSPQSWMKKLNENNGVTDTFSIIDYMRNNPEDYGIVYQAYMRTRYMEGPVTREIMDKEIVAVKNELNGNKTDYTKLAYQESTPVQKEEDTKIRLTANTIVKPEKQ